ncbi:unnamed protein product [Cylicocyclus nassatus]|uniref:Uncharacterized protein n=1 Tax=Cylicocyclus nassatus TaxID=53992 RepID=A0AA36GNW7_CYLNA|nr:unnamed protein product [Cylicocyclus nassatus]
MAENSSDPHEEDRNAEETQEVEIEPVNTSAELGALQQSPQMDESDIAEMSMIAAQIEAAEEFDLTFETVDTSDMQPVEERPKSRRRSKEVSPLHVSDRQEIEEFLEEGLNESAVGCKTE